MKRQKWIYYYLVANPLTSRGVSTDPRKPATVEKRTKTGVFIDGEERKLAMVMLDQSA
jgi:hypothetical protein